LHPGHEQELLLLRSPAQTTMFSSVSLRSGRLMMLFGRGVPESWSSCCTVW